MENMGNYDAWRTAGPPEGPDLYDLFCKENCPLPKPIECPYEYDPEGECPKGKKFVEVLEGQHDFKDPNDAIQKATEQAIKEVFCT